MKKKILALLLTMVLLSTAIIPAALATTGDGGTASLDLGTFNLTGDDTDTATCEICGQDPCVCEETGDSSATITTACDICGTVGGHAVGCFYTFTEVNKTAAFVSYPVTLYTKPGVDPTDSKSFEESAFGAGFTFTVQYSYPGENGVTWYMLNTEDWANFEDDGYSTIQSTYVTFDLSTEDDGTTTPDIGDATEDDGTTTPDTGDGTEGDGTTTPDTGDGTGSEVTDFEAWLTENATSYDPALTGTLNSTAVDCYYNPVTMPELKLSAAVPADAAVTADFSFTYEGTAWYFVSFEGQPEGAVEGLDGNQPYAYVKGSDLTLSTSEQPETSKDKTASDGTKVTITGNIPEDVELTVTPVTVDATVATTFGVPSADMILAVYDITPTNADGTAWQPTDGETVTVTLDVSALGLADGKAITVMHNHNGSVSTLGKYTVSGGKLSFDVDWFSEVALMDGEEVGKNGTFNGDSVELHSAPTGTGDTYTTLNSADYKQIYVEYLVYDANGVAWYLFSWVDGTAPSDVDGYYYVKADSVTLEGEESGETLYDKVLATTDYETALDLIESATEDEWNALTDDEISEIWDHVESLEPEPLPEVILQDTTGQTVPSEIIRPTVNYTNAAPFGPPVVGESE